MRVLGIIPARGGSKRVPGKNRRVLGGKPLFQWAWEAASEATCLSEIAISTDDPVILQAAGKFPNLHVIERPPELSDDLSPAIDYVVHARQTLADLGHAAFDAFAILQPTSPFTTGLDIDQTVEVCRQQAAPCAASVVQLDQALQPAKLKQLEGPWLRPYGEPEQGRMLYQQLPQLYVRNGSVYVSMAATIDSGTILTEPCAAHVMPRERSVDINDPIDFRFAEFLLHSSDAAAAA